MKTSVAITLIVVGALLVAAPILSDYSHRAQVAAALNHSATSSVSLQPVLSEEYRFGCWLVGGAMMRQRSSFPPAQSAGRKRKSERRSQREGGIEPEARLEFSRWRTPPGADPRRSRAEGAEELLLCRDRDTSVCGSGPHGMKCEEAGPRYKGGDTFRFDCPASFNLSRASLP
jgi:hypothetical protein